MSLSNGGLPRFIYKPLKDPHNIRLLCLRAPAFTAAKNPWRPQKKSLDEFSYDLIEVPLSTCSDTYQAVSYSWGKPIKDHWIKINEQYTLPVTESLAAVLSNLSKLCSTGCLWIDQICIDQSNEKEREQQVTIMGDIYRSALEVLIWTGEEVPGLSGALKRRSKQQDPTEYLLSKRHVKALIELLCRPWFSRGWIIQEAVLAKKAVLVSGSCVFTFHDLAWPPLGKRSLNPAEAERSRIGSASLGMIRSLSQGLAVNFGDGFDGLLNGCGDNQISKPRDHVYAFLGLNPDPRIIIKPDYEEDPDTGAYKTSDTRIFTNTARTIINSTHSLDLFRLLPASREPEGFKLPSWVPNWSAKHSMADILTIQSTRGKPKAANGRPYNLKPLPHPQANTLHVSGRIVEYLSRELPNPCDLIYGTITFDWGSRVLERLNALISKLSNEDPNPPHFFNWTDELVSGIDPNAKADLTQKLRYRIVCAAFANYSDPARIINRYDGKLYEINDHMDNLLNHAFNKLHEYQLWYTRAGKFALVPPADHEEGNMIAIIHGSNAPVLLGKGVGDTYNVKGYCYLEDAMHGEAVTWEEHEADVLRLS